MTPQSANTDEHSKVPVPELNPMLNPLLAQNMGRWAEVYFTHPPEEREQAVQELVWQLEQENKDREAEISSSPSPKGFEPNERDRRPTTQQTAVCGGCGYQNPVSQRFCAVCGVSMAPSATATIERIPSAPPVAVAPGIGESWDEAADYESNVPENRQHYFLEPRPGDYAAEIEPPTFGSAEPSFSYSYRIFLGLALAVVLGVLGYMAWHKGQNLSKEGSQAPPVLADQAALPDQSSARKTEQASNQAAPAKAEDASAKAANPDNATETPKNAPATETPKTAEPAAAAETTEAKPAGTAALTPAAKTEKIQPNGNGAEELATAQRYLNGENGRRDAAQAAQWLWKSVAKQNSQATLMLADLYLHGDGIQKNCDQARILLDAAAQKGQSGAATRLRNMPAFGCQ